MSLCNIETTAGRLARKWFYFIDWCSISEGPCNAAELALMLQTVSQPPGEGPVAKMSPFEGHWLG